MDKDFHRKLVAKGKGACDWANTFTEVEHLGNGKFGASITTGHRVFKHNGEWHKHILEDNRATKDCVLIRSAKCCCEVYPFYAKYYDVDYSEVRLYEERWQVQRLFKEPDTWRDVDAYNPQMVVEEYPEPAGDVVKVAVTYDTDYGILTVEYFQRDGNALKHNVTFKNTSGSTETFRVLQKWAGIVADKVDGEEIAVPTEKLKYGFRFEKAGRLQLGENLSSFMPTWQEECEAAKKIWVRHGECNRCGKCCLGCPDYIEKYSQCKIYETRPDFCKEFPWSPEQIQNIPECSYTFEETGVIAYPTKLRPTLLDVHPQGLKATFIYGDWPLAQNESLEIDPDTATLDDPTINGSITFSGNTSYARTVAADRIQIRGVDVPVSKDKLYRGFVEWDVSTILNGSTITNTIFKYHGGVHGGADAEIRAMASQPSVQSDDDAGNQVIFDDIGDGTVYDSPAGFIEVGINKQADLGASADEDLESALVNDWFAIGIKFPNDDTDIDLGYIYAEDYVGPPTPKPTLYVEYTPPPYVLENKSANMGSKMVAAGLI